MRPSLLDGAQWGCLAPIVAACAACAPGISPAPAPAPPRPSGRAALGLPPPDLFARYLEARPAQLKLRHQVETRFGGREEVIEGQVLVRRPDRFWVRATTPFGGTLFEVRTASGGELAVDVRLDDLARHDAPLYLARDIRRVYLVDCPAQTPASAVGELVAVHCALPPGDPISGQPPPGGGPAPPPDRGDDGVTLWLDGAAVLVRKVFERDGAPTAIVDYGDHRAFGPAGGVGPAADLAQRIVLQHQQVDYRITIQLLDADPGFDTSTHLGVD